MSQIAERLKIFRTHLGLSQKNLSPKLGISQQSYAKYELGITEPSCDTFGLLANMGLNIHWLITGIGDMLGQGRDDTRELSLKIARQESKIEELEKQIQEYKDLNSKLIDKLPSSPPKKK